MKMGRLIKLEVQVVIYSDDSQPSINEILHDIRQNISDLYSEVRTRFIEEVEVEIK